MRVLLYSIYYQLIIFLRIKQAVFFTIAYPILLFVLFGSIWQVEGNDYIYFILSGVIGMTIASDGMFAIGPVIKEYYANGLIKYLRKMPVNIIVYFMGLIISRVITLIFITILLCVTAFLVFDYMVTALEMVNFILGIFIGLIIFSFLGLMISFAGIKKGGSKGVVNLIYFVILFTSDAFYPVGEFNELIGNIGNTLPLNQILWVLRGEGMNYLLIIWLIIPVILFVILFKNIKFTR